MVNAMLAAEHFQCFNAVLRPARYKSTTPKSTNSNKFCYFSLPNASLSFPWPATCTFAPLCENLSGSDTKFVARIRNTLILGLVGAYLNATSFHLRSCHENFRSL